MSLNRLEDILNELISDKITARKNAQDSFNNLLDNNKDVIKKLNENSASKSKNSALTWQRVFQFSIRHLEKESAKLEKDHKIGKNVLNDQISAARPFSVLKKTLRKAENNIQGDFYSM